MKFAIIGITGQTGSVAAQTLVEAGHTVRAVVRNQEAANKAATQGYEPFIASVDDVAALTRAFTGVDGAYLMNPPTYTHENMFTRAHQVHESLLAAAKSASLAHAVALSSIGGQHEHGTGNILTTYDFEQQINQSGLNISVVRAANFLDNWLSAIGKAQQDGVLPSMFLPLDKKFPMVSSIDIGRTVAKTLIQGDQAEKLVELKSHEDCSAHDAARILSQLLNKEVTAVAVTDEQIAPFFESIGFATVTAKAFADMMNGFNTDHIVFEGNVQTVIGTVTLKEAFKEMLSRAHPKH
jgi:NAD(P)H dehydrogenase (quinone)